MFQDTANWPLIAPLPSYGRGRERPGGRYISFIHGDGLHDVIITGMYQNICSSYGLVIKLHVCISCCTILLILI